MSAVAAVKGVSGWEVPAVGGSKLDTAEGAQQIFLQLLVAQLKNQNPLNPADGMEFVSQLTQFSELEQLLAMRKDMGAIAEALTAPAAPAASGGAPAGPAGGGSPAGPAGGGSPAGSSGGA
jgi:hypothetical protein